MPFLHNSSSWSCVIMSAYLVSKHIPVWVQSFISLSRVYFNPWNSSSSRNFQWIPFVSKAIWRQTTISYNVLGGKSDPSSFFYFSDESTQCFLDFSFIQVQTFLQIWCICWMNCMPLRIHCHCPINLLLGFWCKHFHLHWLSNFWIYWCMECMLFWSAFWLNMITHLLQWRNNLGVLWNWWC